MYYALVLDIFGRLETGAVYLTEKYRPRSLDEIVGHDDFIRWLKQWLDRDRIKKMPNVIMIGSPGNGKTCIAQAFFLDLVRKAGTDNKRIKELLRRDYLELNASDERGIDVVREKIKAFARTVPLNPYGVKILFLDEFESMTRDAQESLRRIMEDYPHVKWFLAMNDPTPVIPAIMTRGSVWRLRALTVDELVTILKRVVKGEGWIVPDEVLRGIAEASGGSARLAINLLQSIIVDGKVDMEIYEKRVANPYSFVEEVVEKCDSPLYLFIMLTKNYTPDTVFDYISYKYMQDDEFAKILDKYSFNQREHWQIRLAKAIRALWEYKRLRGVSSSGETGKT